MTTVYSTAEVVIPDDYPQPTGYRILIVMPKVEEKTKGVSRALVYFNLTDISKSIDSGPRIAKP